MTILTPALFHFGPDVVSAADMESVTVVGSVSDSEGQAVTGAIVYLRLGPEHEYAYTYCRTNDDGRFQFLDLKPGLIITAAFSDGSS